jgi:tetratricopeptide (TPR) repeat protein
VIGNEDLPLFDTALDLEQILDALREAAPDKLTLQLRERLWSESANGFGYAALGVALAEVGETAAALQAFDRAHFLQPENPQVLYHYGLALLAAGRKADARLRFNAALKLNPAYEDARRELAALAGSARPAAARATEGTPARHDRDRTALAVSPPRLGASRPLPQAPEELPLPDGGGEGGPALSEFGPGPLSAFLRVTRSALNVWGQQPLVWLVLLALPNAAVAITLSLVPTHRWAEVLAWVAALGVGTAPAVLAAAGQQRYGEPYADAWRFTLGRFLRGAALALPYLLLTLGPLAVALAFRTPFRPDALLLGALLFTAPFHVLFAPALVMAATDGPGDARALWTALRAASGRTWVHLAVMLAVGVVLGGIVGLIGWSFASMLHGAGNLALQVLQVAGLSLGESVWVVLVAVCGLDTLFPEGETGPWADAGGSGEMGQ